MARRRRSSTASSMTGATTPDPEVVLSRGQHPTPADGICAMEWVSLLAGEAHSDQPACVSPVLRAFCTQLNDGLEHDARQRLRPFLSRTIGTARDDLDEKRAWAAMDWLIRSYVGGWLSAAGLTRAAAPLVALPPIRGRGDIRSAITSLQHARRATRSAWAHRLGWARPLAFIPLTAQHAATRHAGWSPLGSSAWAAARYAAGNSAGQWACMIAREVAGGAAAIASGTPAGGRDPAARAAAHRSARRAHQDLELSIFQLLDAMLPAATAWTHSEPADARLTTAAGSPVIPGHRST